MFSLGCLEVTSPLPSSLFKKLVDPPLVPPSLPPLASAHIPPGVQARFCKRTCWCETWSADTIMIGGLGAVEGSGGHWRPRTSFDHMFLEFSSSFLFLSFLSLFFFFWWGAAAPSAPPAYAPAPSPNLPKEQRWDWMWNEYRPSFSQWWSVL